MTERLPPRYPRIVPIDPAELAVLMCEACYQISRPAGATAARALAEMDEECRASWLRAAKAAFDYFEAIISARVH